MINTTITKSKCGCTKEYTHFGLQVIILEKHCEQHTKEIKQKEQETKDNFIKRLKNTTDEINCELCNKHICWVDESDLNGSYFICDNCKTS